MGFLLQENNRNGSRHDVMGLMSNLSDGKMTFVGIVEDISANGIRISQVPANFDDTAELCYSIVNGPWDDFAVALKPKWVKLTNRGMYKMIGFEIDNPSKDWDAFIEGVKQNSDPFGIPMLESEIAA